jgi:hypothetical protein
LRLAVHGGRDARDAPEDVAGVRVHDCFNRV